MEDGRWKMEAIGSSNDPANPDWSLFFYEGNHSAGPLPLGKGGWEEFLKELKKTIRIQKYHFQAPVSGFFSRFSGKLSVCCSGGREQCGPWVWG